MDKEKRQPASWSRQSLLVVVYVVSYGLSVWASTWVYFEGEPWAIQRKVFDIPALPLIFPVIASSIGAVALGVTRASPWALVAAWLAAPLVVVATLSILPSDTAAGGWDILAAFVITIVTSVIALVVAPLSYMAGRSFGRRPEGSDLSAGERRPAPARRR